MNNKKILVIDDSKTMRRIISNTIHRIGVPKDNIHEAEDGVFAMSKLKELGFEHFDVILTDINMPNMNGFQVIENIRKVNKEVPIITITTEGGRVEILKALKLGSSNYIVKPFTPQVLKEKLEKII